MFAMKGAGNNQIKGDQALARSSRVRVVRIIDRLNIGGPAKHAVWLTAAMNDEEFETTLITGTVPASEGDMSYFARAAGVEVVTIKEMSRELSPRDLVVTVKLLRQFFKLKPDIIHTHKSKAGAAGRVAAMLYKWMTPASLIFRPRRCHIVHTYHGHVFHSYYSPAKTRLFVGIEKALARFCTDRIVVISEQQRKEISEEFRVGRARQFRIIPLGIDLSEMTRERGRLRNEIGINDDQLLIGTVGRLSEVKNHAMLIEVAARLVREASATVSDARFAIIGDGHLREPIQSLADKLGIAGRVHFTGFREDATSLYSDFDIIALTSLNEGTPLTLIEAMSCGCAVAATEVGGVVDIMGDRQETVDGFSVWDHGVTAASGDVEGFTRALQFLIERPDLRHEMGERGRVFVESRLSRERLVGDIKKLYREMMGIETAPETASATPR